LTAGWTGWGGSRGGMCQSTMSEKLRDLQDLRFIAKIYAAKMLSIAK